MFTIERVPYVSSRAKSPMREEIYATAMKLEIGESFVFPKEEWFTSLAQAIGRGRGRGRKFSCRKVENGYRLCRIA